MTPVKSKGASARAAGLLRAKGIEAGDRVAVMLPNVPYFAILYFGILRAGAVVVPLNPRYGGSEVAYHVGDSEAKLLFGWHQFSDAAEKGAGEHDIEMIPVEPGKFEKLLSDAEPHTDVEPRKEDDAAVILYTSGTTGRPKGAVLTQLTAWWLRQLDGVVRHHMISADAEEIVALVPELRSHREAITGRAMLCPTRKSVLPAPCPRPAIASALSRSGRLTERTQYKVRPLVPRIVDTTVSMPPRANCSCRRSACGR